MAPKLVREFSPTLPTFLHGTNTELSTLNANPGHEIDVTDLTASEHFNLSMSGEND